MTSEASEASEASWRERLRDHPDISDWRSAIGHELTRLDGLLNQRGAALQLYEVKEALEEARQAIVVQRGLLARVKAWWSGWDTERAWRSVHAAEVALVADSDDLVGRLPGVKEQVAKELPATDRRLQALLRLEPIADADNPGPLTGRRVIVSEAMQAAFAVADDALRLVRILRNQMLVFGAVLVLLNLLLCILGSVHPGVIPLCLPSNPRDVCPTGGSEPSGGDVWQVQLFGVLGAVVAVVVLLVRSQPKLITYGLTSYQSLVKIALGATLALIGVLALSMRAISLIPGTPAGLVLTALAFGYAQQIATRFLDNTAGNLVSKAKMGSAQQR